MHFGSGGMVVCECGNTELQVYIRMGVVLPPVGLRCMMCGDVFKFEGGLLVDAKEVVSR